MQDTLTPVELAVRTRFKLTQEQRRTCSLSFILHFPKVSYLELQAMAASKQYLLLEHALKQTKLVAKLIFPKMPLCSTPQIAEANVLISVRTLHGISYAVVAPSVQFIDTGNVKIVWDSLEELETKNLRSISEICKFLDSYSL